MIEPSTVERSEWPEATAAYVDDLEKRVAFLEVLLDEARGLIPNDYDDERKLRNKIDKALEEHDAICT
jgi:hypothetical protein